MRMHKLALVAAAAVVGVSSACHRGPAKTRADSGPDEPFADAAAHDDAGATSDSSLGDAGAREGGCLPGAFADSETLTDPLDAPETLHDTSTPIAFGDIQTWRSDLVDQSEGCSIRAVKEESDDAYADLSMYCTNVNLIKFCDGISNGDGTFSAQPCGSWFRNGKPPGPPLPPPSTAIVADFNGDGLRDQETIDRSCGWQSNISLSAEGAFASGPSIHYLLDSRRFDGFDERAADLNADGLADLLMVSTSMSATVVYSALGRGDGTFEPVVRTAAPLGGWDKIIFLDLNGDRAEDLLGYSFSQSEWRTGVMFSRLDGTLSDAVAWSGAGEFAGDTTLDHADFNGDGRTDLVAIVRRSEPQAGYTDLWFAAALDGGTFRTLVHEPLAKYEGAFFGDFNGDGKTDFLSTSIQPSFFETATRLAR